MYANIRISQQTYLFLNLVVSLKFLNGHKYLLLLLLLFRKRRLASSCLPECLFSIHMSLQMEHLLSHSKDFHEIWYLSIFSKSCLGNSLFIKIWQEWRVSYIKANIHLWSYLYHFFLEWKMFQSKVVEKLETYFMPNNFFFRKSCRLWEKVEKYCRA